jgi:hypothetical protein
MSKPPPVTQSAAERKVAEAELRGLMVQFTPDQLRLAEAARRYLQKRLPTAHEMVYEYRDAFVISYSPNGHGSHGVLALRGSAEGIRLYLNQGKGLPDPEKVLQGSAQARWIPVETAATLRRPAVTALVEAALAANRVPYATTGRGPIVVRLTTAKKRRG